MNNFIAFDFETASGKNPCSIGIVEFENGEVINEYYSLINPNIEKFNPFTTRIHGIRKEDVINEREFNEVWKEICHFFDNKIIVAHNSSFDISVLQYSLDKYNIPEPKNTCYCTLRISRQYLELQNYKLNSLANHYHIKQENYHNALDDAYICGKVFSKLILEIDNIRSLTYNNSTFYTKRKKVLPYNNSFANSQKHIEENIDLRINFLQILGFQTEKLKNLSFVVSGVFYGISRNELKKLIEDNGCKVSSSISSKTSYIVAGDKMGPSKKIKAEQLNIAVITEKEFLNLII